MECDVRRGGGDRSEKPGGRTIANGDRLMLDDPQDLDDSSVLEPGLVIDEAAQLCGERRHRALRVVACVEPVVVDASDAAVRAQGGDRFQ